MIMLLQQVKTTSVRDFINECCKYLKFKIKWIGKGASEKGYLINNGKKELIIKVDKKYYRPLEIDYLRGDPRKAFKKLNYKLKHSLKDLVKDMLDSDIKLFKKKNLMKKTDKIFIAGHNGLVGKATLDLLKKKGFKNLITVSKKKLDLRDKFKVLKYFKNKKIDYMIMAAARAGGIIANSTNQKDFFLENVEIQNSLLNLALDKKIKRTIFLGTSCIYPKHSKTPIKEEALLTGKLEKTNQCYAIAKISGIKLCEALIEDFKLDIICLMPTNVYGHNDNFHKVNGHVIPAMITKFEEAIKKKK